jgi:hypothetical protein
MFMLAKITPPNFGGSARKHVRAAKHGGREYCSRNQASDDPSSQHHGSTRRRGRVGTEDNAADGCGVHLHSQEGGDDA